MTANSSSTQTSCGTYAAVRRHQRRNEELCMPCVEARREYGRNYQERNREKIRAANNACAAKNRQKRRDYYKQHRLNNLEKERERLRQYHYDHPEKTREKRRKRRALELNNGATPYTEDQVLDLYGTDCHICNQPIDLTANRVAGQPGWEQGLHIDHLIPISKGGPDTLSSVRPTHAICNMRKGAKMEDLDPDLFDEDFEDEDMPDDFDEDLVDLDDLEEEDEDEEDSEE